MFTLFRDTKFTKGIMTRKSISDTLLASTYGMLIRISRLTRGLCNGARAAEARGRWFMDSGIWIARESARDYDAIPCA